MVIFSSTISFKCGSQLIFQDISGKVHSSQVKYNKSKSSIQIQRNFNNVHRKSSFLAVPNYEQTHLRDDLRYN